MKIVLVAPDHRTRARGNTVTVDRWLRGATATAHEVVPATPSDLGAVDGPVDIVHAHHAVHCGPAAVRAAERLGARLVVSLGGTDLNETPGAIARDVLRAADLVVGPFAGDADRLEAALGTRPRWATVRRGVAIGGFSPLPRCSGRVEILMVGGLRAVKGQRDAVAWATELARRGVDSRLSFAGPAVEADFAAALAADLEGTPHCTLGELDREGVADEIARCHLLLNASLHEGASNAILEAWAAGRPVAARRAPGNRQMLEPAPAEVAALFDADDLGPLEALAVAVRDARPADRTRLAATAHAWARAAHDVTDEIRELVAAWESALD